MSSEWKTLPGFDGYEVSSDGQMRSWIPFGRKGLVARRLTEPRALVPRSNRGYINYQLRLSGRTVTMFAHRAVLLAFVGPCPSGMETRHVNGKSSDNRLENLSWSTKGENERDKERHGTANIGSRGMRRKLTSNQVERIRGMLAIGVELAAIGRKFSVRWQTIQAIRDGKSWKNA